MCYDRDNRAIDTSCVETIGDAFLNNIRSSMCLSFLMYAIILGYLIAMQFRSNLYLTHVGLALIISSLSSLFGLTLFVASQEIPRKHWLYETRYGWSFGIGWFGMFFSMISGIVCISLPRYEVSDEKRTIPYVPVAELTGPTTPHPPTNTASASAAASQKGK